MAIAALLVAGALHAGSFVGTPEAAGCPSPREVTRNAAGHTSGVDCLGSAGAIVGPARRLFGMAIDPNRADAATLESLPGIGPTRARAIVEERNRRPFTDDGDLVRVRGIGPVTVERLAALIEPADAEAPR